VGKGVRVYDKSDVDSVDWGGTVRKRHLLPIPRSQDTLYACARTGFSIIATHARLSSSITVQVFC